MKGQDKGMDLITSQNVERKGKGRTLENTNTQRHAVQKNEGGLTVKGRGSIVVSRAKKVSRRKGPTDSVSEKIK